MPKPFLELSLDQFAAMLAQFPWTRRVTAVHVHHTFRPNHADFASRPPLQAIEGMFRFHTEERHFADIAQHVTIDPRGVIWTGRNWNAAPASATGFNGNAAVGPFMFEMIGNFDIGQDRWEGSQRDVAIEVIARVQRLFGLPPAAFAFHNELSTKTCPGSAILRADVLDAVKAAHDRLAVPRRAPAADEVTRATVDRILRVFDVDPRGRRGLDASDAELPEADMTLREGEMSAGVASAFAASRAGDTADLTPEDFVLLRRHVVNLRMGAFSGGGVFQSTPEDVRAIFAEHLPAFEAQLRTQQPDATLRLVFFAHGGLNDELQSLKNARNRVPFYLANRCYPIFFVWETGTRETLRDLLGELVGLGPGRAVARGLPSITDFTDAGLERAFRPVGFSLWAQMKLSAERAFLRNQGGTFVVEQLAEYWKQHAGMEIHAIGHSAGAIFLAYFIDALCQQPSNPPITVASLHFLAPAITVDLFKALLMDLVGGRVQSLTEFTMHKDFELADSVGPYRKSLLYLVSRSFEDDPSMPILGLEESIRRDPDLMRFFGLLAGRPGPGEIVFSVSEDGPRRSSIARKHGDFDNDRLTMGGVMRRILGIGDAESIVEFPETVSRTVLDAGASLPAAAAAPAAIAAVAESVAMPPVIAVGGGGPGRRRALCIGIDAYAPPNRLAGCVNDANAWAATLRGLGFETVLLLDGEATWQGIQTAMTELVTSSRPGDVLVFQYAGHGTRVPDVDGDEESGRDSAVCPADFPSGRFLIDDDVRRIFQQLPAGVSLTCFFDCCHSGTITRMVAPAPSAPRGADVRTRGFHATPQQEEAHRRFRAGRRDAAPPPRGGLDMKEISFTACTDAQTAQEVDGHGQFTVRALAILQQGTNGLTNRDFRERVLAAFGSDADQQTPQLDCAPANAARALFDSAVPLALAAPAAAGLEAMAARLDAIERRLGRLGV